MVHMAVRWNELGAMRIEGGLVHDIVGDIIDWDEAYKAYLATEGQTGERYNQRLEAADLMAEIEARWQHLPGGFHGERKRIKIHIQAVADTAPSMSSEELCWLAITAASAWIPTLTPAQATLRWSQVSSSHPPAATREPGTAIASVSGISDTTP
jgi:hypothetical protein